MFEHPIQRRMRALYIVDKFSFCPFIQLTPSSSSLSIRKLCVFWFFFYIHKQFFWNANEHVSTWNRCLWRWWKKKETSRNFLLFSFEISIHLKVTWFVYQIESDAWFHRRGFWCVAIDLKGNVIKSFFCYQSPKLERKQTQFWGI